MEPGAGSGWLCHLAEGVGSILPLWNLGRKPRVGGRELEPLLSAILNMMRKRVEGGKTPGWDRKEGERRKKLGGLEQEAGDRP